MHVFFYWNFLVILFLNRLYSTGVWVHNRLRKTVPSLHHDICYNGRGKIVIDQTSIQGRQKPTEDSIVTSCPKYVCLKCHNVCNLFLWPGHPVSESLRGPSMQTYGCPCGFTVGLIFSEKERRCRVPQEGKVSLKLNWVWGFMGNLQILVLKGSSACHVALTNISQLPSVTWHLPEILWGRGSDRKKLSYSNAVDQKFLGRTVGLSSDVFFTCLYLALDHRNEWWFTDSLALLASTSIPHPNWEAVAGDGCTRGMGNPGFAPSCSTLMGITSSHHICPGFQLWPNSTHCGSRTIQGASFWGLIIPSFPVSLLPFLRWLISQHLSVLSPQFFYRLCHQSPISVWNSQCDHYSLKVWAWYAYG